MIMAQIGYGYGSEFQLLRFLGHHRDLLEQSISKIIGNGTFHWLDFGFSDPKKSISGDEELMGLSFLQKYIEDEDAFRQMMNKYSSYGIGKLDSWQSWDAVFFHEGTLYLVEAKAHVSELKSSCGATEKSKPAILRFMKDQLRNCPVDDTWLNNNYQLANRLATAALIRNFIPAKVLYIFFENGYRKRILDGEKICQYRNLNASKHEFEQAFANEMKDLGITPEQVKDILAPAVYINAEPLSVK